MISVMLVDDHAIIREGMKVLLASDPEISIIGEAGSVKQAVANVDLIRASNVLVLDMFLETESSGLGLLKQLLHEEQHPAILIVSMFTNAALVRQCLGLGAKGYVTKGDASDYLAKAIHTVSQGNTFISPTILASVMLEEPPSQEDQVLELLTHREQDILELLGKGYTTRRMCEQLGISTSTVGTHMENLKYKLHLQDKNSLIRFAIKREEEREQKKRLFSTYR